MGLYDTVHIEATVELPQFPAELDQTELHWQSKDIGHPAMQEYKLTADGTLLRVEREYRNKTAEEKRTEATEHGFESWADYVKTAKETDPQERLADDLPFPFPKEQTLQNEVWVNHNQHGSFVFYSSSPEESEFDITWEYEARFNRGNLEEILLLGDRHSAKGPDEIAARTETHDSKGS